MGLLLSVLFSYVGAIELAFVVRDIYHKVDLHQQRLQNGDFESSNTDDEELKRIQNAIRSSLDALSLADATPATEDEPVTDDDELKRIQNSLRSSLVEASSAEDQNAEQMQDGVQYDNGYRVVTDDSGYDEAAAERWNQRRKELIDADGEISPSEALIKSERTINEIASKAEMQLSKSLRPNHLDAKHSEESSSYEPISQQSSLSVDMPDIHFDEYERPDANDPDSEQLRALDGIKFRPIVRDDGSGRRRAFKKRQQSSSSTESGEANTRSSREEELKMFTSLEEEEFGKMQNSEYAPITYSSDPNLKVKKPHRRHKRSPAKHEANGSDDDDAENGDPWGDVQPKHFHDMDVWKKERATSIVEEIEDEQKDDSRRTGEELMKRDPQFKALMQSENSARRGFSPVGEKKPKLSSFEDATDSQHNIVLNAISRKASIDDVPSSSTVVDKENRKGKNVSKDDDDYAALFSGVKADALAVEETLIACTAELELTIDSSGEESKIIEFISYIEHLDDGAPVDDDASGVENEKFQFKEYLEHPKRLRHTSYNYDNAEDDKEYESIIKNIEENQLVERVANQEEQLKNIQAEIERINNSLTPVTRNLLSPTNLTTTTTHTSTVSSSVFIKHEKTTEEITRIYNMQLAADTSNKTDNSERVEESASQTFAPNESSSGSKSEDLKFVTTEHIPLTPDIPQSPSKFIAMENIFLNDESTSDSRIKVDFVISPSTDISSPYSYNREISWTSADSAREYQRSQSSGSGLSNRYEEEEELEYIRGRQDWLDVHRVSICDEIESDDYHHRRRHSETANTLEYIRGREDWALYQRNATRNRNMQDIRESDADLNVTIRDQIDSDEYHHARRLSECLDLAHGAFSRHGNLFVGQGSARNGRDRSPFHMMRADIDKSEFLDCYYWKGVNEFERSVSEGGDVPDDHLMIHSDRKLWPNPSKVITAPSGTPISFRIRVEHTEDDENEATIIELGGTNDLDDGSHDTLVEIGHSWDLEQSYEDDISEYEPISLDASPSVDVIEMELWNGIEVQDNISQNADIEADFEVTEILTGNNSENNSNQPLTVEKSITPVHSDQGICSPAEPNNDEDSTSVSLMKKSKTTRNLLDVERLSVDLSNNEAALTMLAEKSSQFIKNEKETAGDSGFSSLDTRSRLTGDELGKTLNNTSLSYSMPSTTNRETTQNRSPEQSNTSSSSTRNKSAKSKKSKISLSQDNVDDLVQETSMGKWFHK